MKDVGIVRRIDELGRVVIPKEIRRTMRLSSGDEMEIYLNDNGDIVLRRYSSVKARLQTVLDCCKVLDDKYKIKTWATDRHNVIVNGEECYSEKPISTKLNKILQSGKNVLLDSNESIELYVEGVRSGKNQGIINLNRNGISYGGLILESRAPISKEILDAGKLIGEVIIENIGEV